VLTPPLCPLPAATNNTAAVPPVTLLVKMIGLPTKPLELAATWYAPTLSPTVNIVDACPFTFVVVVARLNICPVAPDGASKIAKVTPSPLTGLPNTSTTVTVSGCVSVLLASPLCPLPDVINKVFAGPAVALPVNIIGLPVRPDELADTWYNPALLPSVNMTEACPFAPVIAFAALKDCPVAPIGVDTMAKLTFMPDTGLPPASVTRTATGLARVVLIVDVWLSPDISATVVAAPAIPVAVKVTGDPVRPPLVAVKVFDPAVGPKVQLPTVAIPLAFVVAVNVVPDPPPVATAKVTLTPLTGLLFASFTITRGDVATAVPTVPDWASPALTAICVATPAT
jgi:hypothetical protein